MQDTFPLHPCRPASPDPLLDLASKSVAHDTSHGVLTHTFNGFFPSISRRQIPAPVGIIVGSKVNTNFMQKVAAHLWALLIWNPFPCCSGKTSVPRSVAWRRVPKTNMNIFNCVPMLMKNASGLKTYATTWQMFVHCSHRHTTLTPDTKSMHLSQICFLPKCLQAYCVHYGASCRRTFRHYYTRSSTQFFRFELIHPG